MSNETDPRNLTLIEIDSIVERANFIKTQLGRVPIDATTWPALFLVAIDLGTKMRAPEHEQRIAVGLLIDLVYRGASSHERAITNEGGGD